MASIILPDRWKRQPPETAKLKGQYGDSQICLIGSLNSSGLAGNAAPGSVRGTIDIRYAGKVGLFSGPNNTSGGYLAVTNNDALKGKIHSGVIVANIPSLINDCALLCTGYSVTDGGFRVGVTANGKVQLIHNNIAILVETSAGAVRSNVPFVIAYSYNGNTGNAQLAGLGWSAVANVVASVDTTSTITSIGSYYYLSNVDPGVKEFYLVAHWAKERSLAELKNLAENPWQIFKNKSRVLYFDAPSGVTVQTLFIVTYPAGTGTPSNAQIVAGQQFSGAAASWAGSAVWTGPGQYLEATGLDQATAYDSAAVIYDGTTYSSVVEIPGGWVTSATLNPTNLTNTAIIESSDLIVSDFSFLLSSLAPSEINSTGGLLTLN